MHIVKSIQKMQSIAQENHLNNIKTGFVPTMGSLHKGHLSLMHTSKKENHKTIVSIFVNPLQFSPHEDFKQYPRNYESDIKILQNAGIDYAFLPKAENIYPKNYQTYLEIQNLNKVLCGISRPHFFKGVATICLKLFHITIPHHTYFGQKDYQQALIIKKLIQDLHLPIIIRILPIIRDHDGLALSSRNKYLTQNERKEALLLHKSIIHAQTLITNGEKNVKIIHTHITKILQQSPLIQIDYVSIVDAESLEKLETIQGKTLIAIAVFINKTRLIDNCIIHINEHPNTANDPNSS